MPDYKCEWNRAMGSAPIAIGISHKHFHSGGLCPDAPPAKPKAVTPVDLSATIAEFLRLAEVIADAFTCKTPGGVGGSQPGMHCAECCFGTMIAASCREEYDFALAVGDVLRTGQGVARA